MCELSGFVRNDLFYFEILHKPLFRIVYEIVYWKSLKVFSLLYVNIRGCKFGVLLSKIQCLLQILFCCWDENSFLLVGFRLTLSFKLQLTRWSRKKYCLFPFYMWIPFYVRFCLVYLQEQVRFLLLAERDLFFVVFFKEHCRDRNNFISSC